MSSLDVYDPYADPEFLEFGGPYAARPRVRRELPGTVTTARSLIYLQAFSPFLAVPLGLALRSGSGEEPGALEGAEAAERAAAGGSALVGLVLLVTALTALVMLVVLGSKLGGLRASTRSAVIALESAVVVVAVAGAFAGLVTTFIILGGFAVAVIALLMATSARRVFTDAGLDDEDGAARFDIRQLTPSDR